MTEPTTAEIQERHDGSVHQTTEFPSDDQQSQCVLDLLNAYNECRDDRDILLKRLETAEQTIAAASELPDKWLNTYSYEKGIAKLYADELQAIMGESE